jgi:hypothetical protein
MKNISAGLRLLLLAAALAVAGGCSKSTEGFDANDISITTSSVDFDGTDMTWSVTLASTSSDDADLTLQIKVRTPGSSTYFYTSPQHPEKLDGKATRSFTFTEHDVSVPSGTTNIEYFVSFSALPA